jgi:hypothetical protein
LVFYGTSQNSKDAVVTGTEPMWAGGPYGRYDNGSEIFEYYQRFGGLSGGSLPDGWMRSPNYVTVANQRNFTNFVFTDTTFDGAVYVSQTPLSVTAYPTVIEALAGFPTGGAGDSQAGYAQVIGDFDSTVMSGAWAGTAMVGTGRADSGAAFFWGSGAGDHFPYTDTLSPADSNAHVFTLNIDSTSLNSLMIDYTPKLGLARLTSRITHSFGVYGGASLPGYGQANLYWIRTRDYPSSATFPIEKFGPVTAATGTATGTEPATSLISAPAKIAGRAEIVQAVLRDGATSLQLPLGRIYLYGMVTGGAAPSSPFTVGQFAQATDTAGQLAAALAYGASGEDGYTTQTGYHVIGGVSIGGSWGAFNAYQGSNLQSGAPGASVNFPVSSNSLVVVIGLAASQQQISLSGIPALQTDGLSSGPQASEGMIIAHAYLTPGTYTVAAQSAALSAGQDPDHMADLVGVFVFSSSASAKSTGATYRPPAPSTPASISGEKIRDVDFRNFSYPSDCSTKMDDGSDPIIRVSNGSWKKGSDQDTVNFDVEKIIYGDVKSDGSDDAVIVTSCWAMTNFSFQEVFVFEMSGGSPTLLARLTPLQWGKGEENNGGDFPVTDIRVGQKELAISFPVGGSHACSALIVTARYRWDGHDLVQVGSDRKPNPCNEQH